MDLIDDSVFGTSDGGTVITVTVIVTQKRVQ